jgi:hyperosmotically inducible periplasmic protein
LIKDFKMKKLTMLFLSGFLLLAAAACTETARTNVEAPETTTDTAEAPDVDTAQETQEDATSDLRRRQLDADIRAREERNNITGGDADRTDGDLQSEVRSKLEANLPASQLTVEAEEGAVAITGTVPTQEQYDRIEPLAKEIKGVQAVTVDVTVVPAQPES